MGAEINPVDVFGVTAEIPPRVAVLLGLVDTLATRIAALAVLDEDHPAQTRQIHRQAGTIRALGRRIRDGRRRFNILCGILGRIPCPDRDIAATCEAEITAVRALLVDSLHDDEKPSLGA